MARLNSNHLYFIEDNTTSWFALRTYYAQEQKVGRFLESHQLSFFIPMTYSYAEDAAGNAVRRLRPAVHNLIFLRKSLTAEMLKAVLHECPLSVTVYSKQDGKGQPYEIPDRDILELRLICDNSFTEPQFVTQEESELEIGRQVKVVHGPLKGIHGKLIRKKKKYYIVKSYAGLGVIVAVSRWCCQPDDD